MTWELGDRVRITHILRRRSYRIPDRGADRKRWEPQHRPSANEGIVIGARTLFDGEAVWGYDEPTRFEQTATVKAYLVATHLYRRPVLVLPEHMERIE